MTAILPIDIADLLYQRRVEASRIEFKGSWNEGPTAWQVLRTVSAFANDLQNLNGGYVILGVDSALLDEQDDREIYRRLRIAARINGREVPRNVGLMFFSDDPEIAFRGARIEAAAFTDGGDTLEEGFFRGPFPRQISDCLAWLHTKIVRHVRKVPDRPETDNWEDYPFAALEEALVNAVYHRSYESPPEPVKVYVYGDRIEITSYPGPVVGLGPEHFLPGAELPAVSARNRRIGELLKDLRMAEARGTGVSKIRRAMAANGSPPPEFRFDEGRTYFTVVLPVHPEAVPSSAAPVPGPTSGGDGLILISLGAQSIRPAVEKSLEELGLEQARFLIDESSPGHVDPTAESRRLREPVRRSIEDPEVGRLHLFYRGPVAVLPMLGALIASSAKPLVVYHYENGRYRPVYTMDRRFLIEED